MGAAVSVTISKLPEELDSKILQKVCGDKFNQAVFDELKDGDGFVSRADLLAYIGQGEQSSEPTVVGDTVTSTANDSTVPVASLEVATTPTPPDEATHDNHGNKDGEDEEDDEEHKVLSEAQVQTLAAREAADEARGVADEALENESSSTNTTHTGLGVYRWAEHNHLYAGEWKDGKHHGKGVMTFANGGSYEGEWEEGKKHGVGIYRGANGTLYEGQCKEDKREGFGSFRFPDGRIYEGAWLKDKCVGRAVIRELDGTVTEV